MSNRGSKRSAEKLKQRVNAEEFPPFKRYQENRDALTKHNRATDMAYALAVCTLVDPRVKASEPVSLMPAKNFSKADFGIRSIQRVYGWVSLVEYSELERIPIEEVKRRVEKGELGRVEKHPKSGLDIVIWPTSKSGSPEAENLALGLSTWSAEVREPRQIVGVEFDPENEASLDEAHAILVHLGRGFGEPEVVYTEALELFYRGSFLNLWSSFEIFIKDCFGDLVRRFPLSLAALPEWKKLSISYADLVAQTGGLQDISLLREILINTEVAKAESGGRSVSGLINLLKTLFVWPEDLYERPYREGEATFKTKFTDLDEIRKVRNILAHQNVQQADIPRESRRLRWVDNRPVVDKDYLDWADVILSAIAHGISEDVVGERVSVAN